jgi:hypothetical protein
MQILLAFLAFRVIDVIAAVLTLKGTSMNDYH